MTSKTTTYMVKGGSRERLTMNNLATIPGVEVSNRETKDIVPGRRRRTGETPRPAEPDHESYTVQRQAATLESQRPTIGVGIDAPQEPGPASRFETNEFVSPETELAFESADSLKLEPEGQTFQPPWSSSPPSMRDTQEVGTQSDRPTYPPDPGPPRPAARPTVRQAFVLVSFQAGSESVTVPGLSTAAHLPVVRLEATFTTYEAAYSAACRFNRAHASAGKVYAVNAVNLPM